MGFGGFSRRAMGGQCHGSIPGWQLQVRPGTRHRALRPRVRRGERRAEALLGLPAAGASRGLQPGQPSGGRWQPHGRGGGVGLGDRPHCLAVEDRRPDQLGHHQEPPFLGRGVCSRVLSGWRASLRLRHGSDARSHGGQRSSAVAVLRLEDWQEARSDP